MGGALKASALSFVSAAGVGAVLLSGVGGELTDDSSFAATTQEFVGGATVWLVALVVAAHLTSAALRDNTGGEVRSTHRALLGAGSAAAFLASFVAAVFGGLAFFSEFTAFGGVVGSAGQLALFSAVTLLAVISGVAAANNTLRAFGVSVSVSFERPSPDTEDNDSDSDIDNDEGAGEPGDAEEPDAGPDA